MLTQFPLPTVDGPVVDPVGAHVTMRRMGRQLLGEVRSFYRQPGTRAVWLLRVHHFDGTPWPVEPMIGMVEVLERTYEQD
jgi:hypothetical protein